jgi:flap endonuclease-1
MGVAITELLEGKEIEIEDLKGKTFAVDAFNMLYQFLTTIRMQDGTPLRDSKGNVTSHLIGLFSRSTTLMAQGLKLAFVFDGEPPELKKEERERRKAAKAEALHLYKKAEAKEDIEEMKKYAGRTATLNKEMVKEAKSLIGALGLPIIQAPSEGEAQAAYMCKRGDVYAVISQDADAFLFGATRVVKNLNLSGRRKKGGALAYEKVAPELLILDESLKALGLTQEQLIILAILVGTDYNRGGIKGIGPKKALKLLEEHPNNYEKIFEIVEWKTHYPDLDWRTLLETFKNIPVTDEYELRWRPADQKALYQLLVDEHDFSGERITSAMAKLASSDAHKQKGLGEYF